MLDFIGDRPLDKELEFQLNGRFGPHGGLYVRLAELLRAGVDEGWVAYAPVEGAGYNRGRIAAPCRDTAGMSVESGLMRNVRGQYHRHTRGEIDMVIPIDDGSQWCGHGAGWVVYPPGSEHFPTVSDGKALVMFFLPNGEIEYMDPPAELATNALCTNASLPRLGSGQQLSKNPGLNGLSRGAWDTSGGFKDRRIHEPHQIITGCSVDIADVTRFSRSEILP